RNRLPDGASVRQGDVESGTLIERRFQPHTALMILHDLTANGESESGALVLLIAVKAFERIEDLLVIPGVDSDPVVANAEDPLPACEPGFHVDHGRPSATILDGIAQQVPEQTHELALVGMKGWHRVHGDVRVSVFDWSPQLLDGSVDHGCNADIISGGS